MKGRGSKGIKRAKSDCLGQHGTKARQAELACLFRRVPVRASGKLLAHVSEVLAGCGALNGVATGIIGPLERADCNFFTEFWRIHAVAQRCRRWSAA